MKLSYDKAYYFRYKAIGEGKLHVYDKTPLIFILDIRPDSILGLNMHWVPRKDRAQLYEDIMEIFDKNKGRAKKRTRLRLTYALLQKPKYRVGLNGIRMYYLKGITRLKEIEPKSLNVVLGRYGRYFNYRMRKVYKHRKYKD